jgi:hypothetical protein
MTRKHFEALAYNLRMERPDRTAAAEYSAWGRSVVAVADVCIAFNGAFDRGRFYRAAGLDR